MQAEKGRCRKRETDQPNEVKTAIAQVMVGTRSGRVLDWVKLLSPYTLILGFKI